MKDDTFEQQWQEITSDIRVIKGCVGLLLVFIPSFLCFLVLFVGWVLYELWGG